MAKMDAIYEAFGEGSDERGEQTFGEYTLSWLTRTSQKSKRRIDWSFNGEVRTPRPAPAPAHPRPAPTRPLGYGARLTACPGVDGALRADAWEPLRARQ
jgi:hypothetical protein